jgi:hypothetical protein
MSLTILIHVRTITSFRYAIERIHLCKNDIVAHIFRNKTNATTASIYTDGSGIENKIGAATYN